MSAPLDEAGDRDLLSRHAAGDPRAFGVLAARHHDRLWRVALRTLGDADDAADALQDALLSAYRAASGYRGDAAVTTWLHRIVVNACLDLVRRRRSRPAEPLEERLLEATPAPDALSQRETSSEVLAALRQLPIEQAAAIVLVDVEGYPVAEAADMLDVPVGTVKSRCSRGRLRLAELLGHLRTGNPVAGPGVLPVEQIDPGGPRSAPAEETT